MLFSLLVAALLVKQIFLSRDLAHAQTNLIDNQEEASQAGQFENAWQKLAMALYQAGPEDPALLEILKKENIGIKSRVPPPSSLLPSTTSPESPVPAKAPALPHP
jgi:hypothetical protein